MLRKALLPPQTPSGKFCTKIIFFFFFPFFSVFWNFFHVMEYAMVWHHICAVGWSVLTSLDVFNFPFGFQSAEVNEC